MSIRNPECVFCGIAAGDEPASIVVEDEHVVAFMDITPVNPGETIVIPREHIDHFSDLSDAQAFHIIKEAQVIARRMREVLKPERVGYVIHGYGVPHAHLNIVPLLNEFDVTSAKFAEISPGGEIQFNVDRILPTNRAELDDMARLLSDK